MKETPPTLEAFLARYATEPADIKQAMLAAGMKATAGVEIPEDEPYLSLTEVTPKTGYRHYTALWRLGVKTVAENFGGRPRYKLSKVLAFLRSAECQRRRAELRHRRQEREKKAVKA